MNDLWGGIGIGIILLCLLGPLAYCESQSQIASASVKKACIEQRGEWSSWSGGSCSFADKK